MEPSRRIPGDLFLDWAHPSCTRNVGVCSCDTCYRGTFICRLPLVLEVSLWVTLCCIGIPLCTIATRQLGGQKDPSSIVIDEFLAMPLVLLVVSPEQRTWPVILIAFLLFRLFDITKPPPCRQLENLPQGLGVMADDWAAAGLSACALFVISFFLS